MGFIRFLFQSSYVLFTIPVPMMIVEFEYTNASSVLRVISKSLIWLGLIVILLHFVYHRISGEKAKLMNRFKKIFGG